MFDGIQKQCNITEKYILSIVETLKNFKAVLLILKVKMYTNHKILLQDVIVLNSD